MNLDTLLQELSSDNAAFEKSASEVKDTSADKSARALRESLQNVQQKLASERTYQSNDNEPLSDLVKMASDLGNADHINLLKEANVYGAGVADGFVGRLNEYNSVDFTKVASENDVPDHLIEKIATEAIEGFLYAQQEKLAAEQQNYNHAPQAPTALPPELDGYVKTAAFLEKTAQDSYLVGRHQAAQALGFEKSAVVGMTAEHGDDLSRVIFGDPDAADPATLRQLLRDRLGAGLGRAGRFARTPAGMATAGGLGLLGLGGAGYGIHQAMQPEEEDPGFLDTRGGQMAAGLGAAGLLGAGAYGLHRSRQ